MPHEIANSDGKPEDAMFYSVEHQWHRLGVIDGAERTATEALTLVGEYEAQTVPVAYLHPLTGEWVPMETCKQVVRKPMKGDDQYRVFGNPVGKGWTLILPKDAAAEADKNIALPIYAMGVLKNGATLFFTYKLPTFEVKGREIQNYLVFESPVKPGRVVRGIEMGHAVVCMNTLRSAIEDAEAGRGETYTIPHREGALELVGDWMKWRVNFALASQQGKREVYELLANRNIAVDTVRAIAAQVYPDPKRVDANKPRKNGAAGLAKAMREYETQSAKMQLFRNTVVGLFDGGDDTLGGDDLRGTAWAAYMAFTKFASHRRGVVDHGDEATFSSLMGGTRGGEIVASQRLILEAVR